jgi:hypothetical protein
VDTVENSASSSADEHALADRLERLDEAYRKLVRRARSLERRRQQMEEDRAVVARELARRRAGLGYDSAATARHFVAADYASVEVARSTIAEACDYILRRAGRPLTVHQLLEVFDESGRGPHGANAHRVVYAALRRNRRRFTRVRPGTFDLAEVS